VISPLLSNIYLHPLDLYWEREVKATKMVAMQMTSWCCADGSHRKHTCRAEAVPGAAAVTVNEDKTRIVAARWLRLLGALSETAIAARCQQVVLLLLAIATFDAADRIR